MLMQYQHLYHGPAIDMPMDTAARCYPTEGALLIFLLSGIEKKMLARLGI